MGKKTQQNFLNIDSQYNAKTMNQATHQFLSQRCAFLSLPSSLIAAPNLRSDEQVSVCLNEALAYLIYTI
jgi:hypothetical protein